MTPSPPGSDAPYHLRLFGGPVLSTAEGEEVSLTPMQLALVGLVFGYENERLSRSRIAWLLWEEDDDASTRHRIRQLLYATTKRLGGISPFEVDGEEVRAAGEGFGSDLRNFTSAMRAGDFERPLDLLDEPFLVRTLSVCPKAFDDWRDARELALRSSVLESAARKWTIEEERCRWAEARLAAEALIRLDPTSPRFLEAVVKARVMAGAPAEAEAAITNFRDRGGRISPQQTSLLHTALKDLRARTVKSQSAAGSHPGPFVGRSVELSSLLKIASEPWNEGVTTVLLTGDPGVGKTRLLSQVEALWRLRGISVLASGCGEFERNIPLTPLLDVISQPPLADRLATAETPIQSLLGPVVISGDQEARVLSSSRGLPYKLGEAIRRLLQNQASADQTVLMIDDFQWVDDTSIGVLQHVMRRWEHAPFILLLSFRSDAQSINTLAGDFLAELVAQGNPLIELAPMSDQEVLELVDALTPPQTPHSIKLQIANLSAGLPFFATELALEYDRRITVARNDREVSLPRSLRELLLARTRRLSPLAQEILELIAVASGIGRSQVSEILKISGESVIEAVRELSQAQLIRPTERVTIKHELMRQAVVSALDPDRRRSLHLQCASLIDESRVDGGVGQSALHFFAAGDRRRAHELAVKAAASAESQGAVSEAIRFLEIAKATADDVAENATASQRLARLHYRTFDLASVIRHASEAESALEEIGDASAAAESALLRIEAESEFRVIGHRTAIERLESLILSFKAGDSIELYLNALERKARLCERIDQPAEVQRVISQTRDVAFADNPRAEALARSILALDLMFGSGTDALEDARRAFELSKTIPDDDFHAKMAYRYLYVLMFGGQLNSGIGKELLSRCRELGEQSGDFRLQYNAIASEGCWLLDIGELDAAERIFARASAPLHTPSTGSEHISLPHNLGELATAREEWETGRIYFKEAVATESFGDRRVVQDAIYAGLGLCELKLGNITEAREMAERVEVWDRHWYSDPTLVVRFAAELARLKRRYPDAIEVLGNAIADTKHRWPAIGVKLAMLQIPFLNRLDPDRALALADAVREEGIRRGFQQRQRQAEAWIDRLSRS